MPTTSSRTGSSISPITSGRNSPTTALPPPEPGGPALTPPTDTDTAQHRGHQHRDGKHGSETWPAEDGVEPTADATATGTATAQPESPSAAGDDAAAEPGNHAQAPATECAAPDNDSPAATDDTTVGPVDDDRDDQPSATTETTDTDADTDTACETEPSPSSGADNPAAAAGAPATAATTKRRGGNRVFTRQGRRPHLSVTLGLGTLAGLDNLPGSLAGFGAIPAGLARSIAASAATINALITDPDTGRVTAAGALTYRPTQELRDQIAAILNVCQFPSCRQPVWRCDMDHRAEFNHQHPEQGGKTEPRKRRPVL